MKPFASGRRPACESYLKIDRIISAAEIADVDAIHPGYGFLSENAHFAEVCASCNIKFIGPPASAIRLDGRQELRSRMRPQSRGARFAGQRRNRSTARRRPSRSRGKSAIPVMIKAVAGGGGRGMRVATMKGASCKVTTPRALEADKAFGNSGVYIEKFIDNPHHIEFQILGDQHGQIIHLGRARLLDPTAQSKDCRGMPFAAHDRPKLREKMGAASIKLAENVGYTNAGTIEFLVDDHGNYYFMEMNTRIQVEHPITEEVYGCDLVKQQIQVAAGEHLSRHLVDAMARHHSIECRINAEDPANNFIPCPGRDRIVLRARRARRANRLPCLRRISRAAVLRLDDRQGHYHSLQPQGVHTKDVSGPGGIYDYGHQDDHTFSAGDLAKRGLSTRHLSHRVRREDLEERHPHGLIIYEPAPHRRTPMRAPRNDRCAPNPLN